MDEPTGNSSGSNAPQSGSKGPPPRGNLIYAERLRERLESLSKDAQAIGELSKPYREEAREQINRALPQGNWPAHLAITGVTRDKIVAHGEGLIAALAGTNGASLESQQVEAVADSLMANARSTSMLQWGMFSGTMFMAYIHRNKMPSRIMSQKSRLFKLLWPGMLFIAYSIPVSLFVSPVVLAVNAKFQAKKFRKDPRLNGLNVDLTRKLHQFRHNQGERNTQFSEEGFEAPGEYSPPPPTSSTSYQEVARAAAPAWGRSSQSPPRQESSSKESSGWGFDDDDDASPIAPSSRGSYDSGLSAWDRVRVQSGSQQRPAPARPAQQPPQAAGASWGQDSSQSYTDSYSSSTGDQYGSRSQAQAEFDALLDRERRGQDEGRGSSWGR